jgi:hypothetical protein
MALSVTAVAPTRRLTTAAAVQAELFNGTATDTSLIETLIDEVTAAIESYCCRTFARQSYTETLPGHGSLNLRLKHAPLIAVSSVTRTSSTITDYEIQDRNKAWLYRQAGWDWTAQVMGGLTAWQSFPGRGAPMVGQNEPQFSVAYTAGYILPGQAVTGTVSAAAADNSFNDSASGFPALLKAGDIVVASGFSTAANNGAHIVTGTPTTSKIVVSSTLSVEAAGAGKAVKFRGPGDVRLFDDVERAAIAAVKTAYLTRRDDPAIAEKSLGSARVRYDASVSEYTGTVVGSGLPAIAVGLLASWVRRSA